MTVTANDGQEAPDNTESIAVTINITDVDEPPVKMATPTFSDTGRYETTVKWVKPSNTGRPDISKYQLRYGKNVTDPIYTVVDAGTELTLTVMELDDDQAYRFQVQAKNAEGDSPWSDPGIVSTPANRLPVFTDGVSASRSLLENSAENTNVGDPIAATDQDNDTREYSISGMNSGGFTVDSATGQLLAGEHDYDFETTTSYTLTLKVEDGHDGENTIPVTVTITNVDEPPGDPAAPTVIAGTEPRSLDVSWAAPANTGPDINDYDLQYRQGTSGNWTQWIHNGADSTDTIKGLVAGKTHQVQVKARNPEEESEWSPSGQGSTDPNRPPAFDDDQGSSATSRFITETLGDALDTGRTVGTPVAATDADGGTPTYTLDGTDKASFDIDPLTGQISTRTGQVYDHEEKGSYSLTVAANDNQEQPEGTSSITVTVNITDEEEPPVKMDAPTFSDTGRYETTPAWTAPPNTGRPTITGYELRYGTGINVSTHTTKDASSSLSLKVESLERRGDLQLPGQGGERRGLGPVVGVRRHHHPSQPGPQLHSRRCRQPLASGEFPGGRHGRRPRGHDRRRRRYPGVLAEREQPREQPRELHGGLGNRTDQSRRPRLRL